MLLAAWQRTDDWTACSADSGKASIAKPGGDKIGRRRLDTHFLGFKYLGASFVMMTSAMSIR